MKRELIKGIAVGLLILIAPIILVACASKDDEINNALGKDGNYLKGRKIQITNEPILSTEKLSYGENWYVHVKGQCKNISSDQLSIVMLEFSILNTNGSQIATAYDTLTSLAKGGTWEFDAFTMVSQEPKSFKFADATAH